MKKIQAKDAMRDQLPFLNLEELSPQPSTFFWTGIQVGMLNPLKSRPFYTTLCCLYRWMGKLQVKGKGEKAVGWGGVRSWLTT